MTAAVVRLSRGGSTNDPILVAYLRAQKINLAAGGVVIAPWELNDLNDDWVNGAAALMDMEKIRTAEAKIENRLRAWRATHPGYVIRQ